MWQTHLKWRVKYTVLCEWGRLLRTGIIGVIYMNESGCWTDDEKQVCIENCRENVTQYMYISNTIHHSYLLRRGVENSAEHLRAGVESPAFQSWDFFRIPSFIWKRHNYFTCFNVQTPQLRTICTDDLVHNHNGVYTCVI